MTSVQQLPYETHPDEPAAPPTPSAQEDRAGTGRYLSRGVRWSLGHPGLLLSAAVLLLVLAWALVPSVFTSQDPLTGVAAVKLRPPSSEHLFGTDYLGRDVFARVVHGAGASLRATIVAVVIAFVFGCALGTLSGFTGGVVDEVLMRVVDILLAIPGLLFSLTLVMVLGFGWMNVAIAVGAASIASFARLSRAEVLRAKASVSVEAAVGCGVRPIAVLTRHVVPQSIGPVAALAVLEFGSAMLAVSSLSFLGFGSPPPQPEWGSLVANGRDYLSTAWWLSILPGLVILIVVLAFGRLSRQLRRRGGLV